MPVGQNQGIAVGKSQGVLRYLLHAPVYLYRWHLGRLLGYRFLLLIHIGRRSGRRHETVLEVVQYRKALHEAVVMSGFGRNSDWLLNIQATPDVTVAIDSQRFRARYRFLGEDEAVEAFRDYERRNRLVYPVLRYVLSRLLGWRYSGSETDIRKAVAQLPLVAFRPAD
jgi:deazaflavin-dependent oxidoreductase (nitroreductase family)